ncbi:mevalonate kinase [Candidatus Roizmanbacteria bacterium]|nr:mevalonate kinase [Candidatus Roizmanbacteria bacterium]
MKTLKHENKKITVSAPGKLLLLGDHAVVYGNPCLVTAVNYRVFAEVSSFKRDEFIFPDGNKSSFVETALKLFRNTFQIEQKVRVKTWADYKESYGLGSSSAVTVAFVKALAELFSITLSKKELFNLCYDVVLKVQGVGSGFDIAAAIWGGTLYFVTGGKKIKPYTEFIDNLPLVVAYSGSKGNTAELVKKVAQLREEKKDLVNELFAESEWIVNTARDFLIAKSYQSLGLYMNNNHHLLQQFAVSTPKLDELVEAARKAGAYGAKLSGAGGGDCMIAIIPEEKRNDIETALKNAGGTILSVVTNEEGVRIE